MPDIVHYVMAYFRIHMPMLEVVRACLNARVASDGLQVFRREVERHSRKTRSRVFWPKGLHHVCCHMFSESSLNASQLVFFSPIAASVMPNLRRLSGALVLC